MPALPPVSKVLRVAFNGSYNAWSVANVLHWQYDGSALTPSDAAILAADFSVAWHSNVMTHLSNDYFLTNVKVEDLTSDTAAVGEWVGSLAGAEAAEGMPNGVAIVVSHKIARRYRGGHPRTYLCGVLAAAATNSRNMDAANVLQFENDWAAFRAAVIAFTTASATPLSPVNVSYRSHDAARVTPVVDAILTSAVQPRLCSQRRRYGPLATE